MPHPVLDAAARYRTALLASERASANRLVEAYGRTFASLQVEADSLAQSLPLLGENVSVTEIRRLAALRSLQQQVVVEVERYAAFADVEINTAVSRSIELGLQGSLETVQTYFANPRTRAAIGARWDMLAAESVETMLGYTAADSPLRQALVGRLGETVATRVGDALVQGIALGINPRDVVNIIRRELGTGLTWSLTTARTAQIWAYRDTTRLNYMNNRDIVSGWRWQAALDDRTCMSCWAQHGSVHGVDEILNDHHNGRCTSIPIVPLAARLGIRGPDIPSGEKLFKGLSEVEQRKIMGPGLYDAWREGKFDFRDMSVAYADPIYGDMLRQAPLKELVRA